MYFVWVAKAPLVRNHPMWANQKPRRVGECQSASSSECWWWCRWCAAHQSGPRCTDDAPHTAITNWKARDVLNDLCEK